MRRDALLLEEIITAAERATSIATHHSTESLEINRDAHDALLWNLAIVGEAVGQLTDEVRLSFPDIPWNHPVRLRNRVVHGYWSVDLELIRDVALTDLPGFADALRPILESMPTHS
jgi:uncharacterized protein with HEPN domain